MVFARTSKAAARLSEQFRERTVGKFYQAVIRGAIHPESGELNIVMIKENRMAREASDDETDAKPAHLKYRTLVKRGNRILIEIELLSGRFHQIRFQFSQEGHPVLGDTKYGATPHPAGLALRSVRLTFTHPTKKEPLVFESQKHWADEFLT